MERQRMDTPARQSLNSYRRRVGATYVDVRQSFVGEGILVLGTAIGLVIVCLCGALIATLVDDVSESDGVTTFDHQTLTWVLEHRTPTLTDIARTVTHVGDPWVIVAVTVLSVGVLFAGRRFRLGCFVILATSGAAIVSSVAKQAIDRGRPPESLWLGTAWGPSFPSGHATQSVACWGALAIVGCVLVRSTAWRTLIVSMAALIALVVGTSRIYLAVHWLSDVICGWAIGSLWLATLVIVGWSTPRAYAVWTNRRTADDRPVSPGQRP